MNQLTNLQENKSSKISHRNLSSRFGPSITQRNHTTVPESPPRIAIQPSRPNLLATSLGVSPAEFTILTLR